VKILEFVIRLSAALMMGATVGLERQWRQRMAGMRTNALVSAGASAFVMYAFMVRDASRAESQIVSYVVSGVGFLVAGVIFKDAGGVRGLNTAATIWCSAAIGAISGLGNPLLALILTIAVLCTNIVLRPLAHRLYPAQVSRKNKKSPMRDGGSEKRGHSGRQKGTNSKLRDGFYRRDNGALRLFWLPCGNFVALRQLRHVLP
jgi:uncharacterized membrane protein YhiD involved in acid resistance